MTLHSHVRYVFRETRATWEKADGVSGFVIRGGVGRALLVLAKKNRTGEVQACVDFRICLFGGGGAWRAG